MEEMDVTFGKGVNIGLVSSSIYKDDEISRRLPWMLDTRK
jgi:hypothetical protein